MDQRSQQRFGRAISLRSMAKKQYNATQKTLKHHGSYPPSLSKPDKRTNFPMSTGMGNNRMGHLPAAWLRRCAQTREKSQSFIRPIDE